MASVSPPVDARTLPRFGERTSIGIPLISAVILGYLLFLPPQFVLEIGGFILPGYRVFLVLATLYILAEFVRGRLRHFADFLVVVAAAWIAVALLVVMGPARAMSGAGSQFIDIALAYLFARCVFRQPRDLRIFLVLMSPGLFLAGGIILLESLSGQYIVGPIASSITGRSQTILAASDYFRLGLLRGTGPFPHPILAGFFLSSFLALYVMSGLRGWPRIVGVVSAVLGFFSLSSAALLSLVATSALLVVDWIVKWIANVSWWVFSILGGLAFIVLEFGTNSGAIGLIMRYGALNQSSAFYRRLIWQYGSDSVAANPLWGVGFNEWQRPHWMSSSVDNYWLLLAIQYGILPPLFLLSAIVLAILALSRRQSEYPPVDAALLRGVAIALFVAALAAFSVAIWLSMQVWFFMLLGIAISLSASPKIHPTARV